MPNYKLFAFDMDGTLLTNSNTILPSTLDALKTAREHGIAMTITTGRSLQGIEEYRRQLPLSVPVITCNGAMVITLDGEILFEKNLDEADALAIFALERKPETRVIFWCENNLYVDRDTKETRDYAKLSNASFTVFEDPTAYAQKGITKILWIDTPNVHTETKKKLSEKNLKNVTYCVSKPEFLEFFHKNVSKGTALEFLCNYLSIPLTQAVAFGDGDNDIPLLKAAGLGIAMGNASPLAKKCADQITASNENGGIAYAIKTILKE